MSILLAKTDPFIWILRCVLFCGQSHALRTPYYIAALAATSFVLERFLWSHKSQTSSLYQYCKLGNTAYYEFCESYKALYMIYKDNKTDIRPRLFCKNTENPRIHRRVDRVHLMRLTRISNRGSLRSGYLSCPKKRHSQLRNRYHHS